MRILFTSDTHFGHKNIIKYSNRPFGSVNEMNERLIENWNHMIGPNDTVYHLGDVAMGANATKYLRRLNGKKYVCFGNHDSEKELNECVENGIIEWCGHVKYVRWNGEKFWLSHYAHRVWPSSHHGSFHLYGHTHGDLPGRGRSMDVGVDSTGYTPISIERVISRLKKEEFSFHHPQDNPAP